MVLPDYVHLWLNFVEEVMHDVHLPSFGSRFGGEQFEREQTAEYWHSAAQNTLRDRVGKKLNTSK